MRQTLIDSATQAGDSTNAIALNGKRSTVQMVGKMASGSGSAVADILVSNTPNISEAAVAGTITVPLTTTSAGDGFDMPAPWQFVWARLKSITAGGTVSVYANS